MSGYDDDDPYEDETALQEECENTAYIGRIDSLSAITYLTQALQEACSEFQNAITAPSQPGK